jgi:acetyl-CoA synthetase
MRQNCLVTENTLLKQFFSAVAFTMLQFSGARRDEDGYLWVTGRVDDMLNVSGHLLSTAEVESTLSEHPNVAEVAVVAQAHPIKGECLYCFVTPNEGVEFTKKLTDELKRKGKSLHF